MTLGEVDLGIQNQRGTFSFQVLGAKRITLQSGISEPASLLSILACLAIASQPFAEPKLDYEVHNGLALTVFPGWIVFYSASCALSSGSW